jgi:hypothetical protein
VWGHGRPQHLLLLLLLGEADTALLRLPKLLLLVVLL